MEQVIKVRGLKKYYREVKAVDGIDFQVERGELFGFLGVNGAGKSTTINMLCTLLGLTAGEAEICGCRLGREDEAIRRKIGVVWQNNCLDKKLTVKENLYVRGSLYGQKRKRLKESIDKVCDRLSLGDVYGRRYENLSGGQKRRCEIGAALINTPEILFLDEPTTGLDPATRQMVWKGLEEMRQKEGVTVFLTTHYMEEAARAGHIAVIDGGKIKETGTPFELKERFARDRLRLVPAEGQGEAMRALLERYFAEAEAFPKELSGKRDSQEKDSQKKNNAFEWKEGYFLISLSDSLASLPIIGKTKEILRGFELVQGSMDDVFLNITGKTLEKADGR